MNAETSPTTEAGRSILAELRPVFGDDLPNWTFRILDVEREAAENAIVADLSRLRAIEVAAGRFADATVDYRSVLNREFPLDEYRALRAALSGGEHSEAEPPHVRQALGDFATGGVVARLSE